MNKQNENHFALTASIKFYVYYYKTYKTEISILLIIDKGCSINVKLLLFQFGCFDLMQSSLQLHNTMPRSVFLPLIFKLYKTRCFNLCFCYSNLPDLPLSALFSNVVFSNVMLFFSPYPCRELTHRSIKGVDEPKFKLHEYVNKEMETTSCCRT